MQLLLAITVSLLMFYSCKSEKRVQSFQRPVRTYQITPLNFVKKSFAGVVESQEVTILAFKMGGELISVDVSSGDKVVKGQLIAAINPSTFTADVDAAKAQFLNAESDVERYGRLLKRNAVSQQQYEATYAGYISAQSAYKNAQTYLEETKIYAPFDGVVSIGYVDAFQRVQAAEPIVKIVNPYLIEINFTVAPNDAHILNSRDVSYYVLFDNYPTVSFSAKLKKFVDISMGTEGFPVTVVIDDPLFSVQKYDIRPGYTCNVILEVQNPLLDDIVAIPITAVYANKSSNDSSVWIYNSETSSVYLQKVKLGKLVGNDMIAVREGLNVGERVVSAGVYQLTEGEKVKSE